MYDTVIKLVKEEKNINEYGDTVVTETEREVFADVKSVRYSEFYQAQAVGLKPEITFVLPDVLEYEDELIVRYARYAGTEEEYTVLRTYQNSNELELTCKRGVDR